MNHQNQYQMQESMKAYNLIAVIDQSGKKWLMCKRRKHPYQGLYNLVGGKIGIEENHDAAAYRELQEETSITKQDIKLTHLLDFVYPLDSTYVEVYAGRLHKQIEVFGEENDLVWFDLDQDFFTKTKFAGEGNIGHILEHIYLANDRLHLLD